VEIPKVPRPYEPDWGTKRHAAENLAKRWMKWIEKFKEAVRERKWAQARNYLRNLIRAARECPKEVEEIVKEIKNLKTCLQELGLTGEEIAEVEAFIEEVATLAQTAAELAQAGTAAASANPLTALIFVVIVVGLMVGSMKVFGDELPKDERGRPKKPQPPFKLPPELKGDPTLDFGAMLKSEFFKLKSQKRHNCACSRSTAYAPLGGNFEGELLAMQSGPVFLPGQGGGGGGGSRRPDPLSFPTKGGKPLPRPGEHGKPGDTLPGKPPVGVCLWPLCRDLRGTRAS
jgi:hypothetical protein